MPSSGCGTAGFCARWHAIPLLCLTQADASGANILKRQSSSFLLPPAQRCLQIGQASLQARGREHSRMLADLKQTEAELARFRGLPADDAAARAAAAEKRGELERLRRRLQEHVNAMQ